jgi:hypothetical protein
MSCSIRISHIYNILRIQCAWPAHGLPELCQLFLLELHWRNSEIKMKVVYLLLKICVSNSYGRQLVFLLPDAFFQASQMHKHLLWSLHGWCCCFSANPLLPFCWSGMICQGNQLWLEMSYFSCVLTLQTSLNDTTASLWLLLVELPPKFQILVGILQNSKFCRKLLSFRPEPRSAVLFFIIFCRPEPMNLDQRCDTRTCRSQCRTLP